MAAEGFVASLRQSQDGTQVVDDRLKHSGFEPALRLLIDRCPRGRVMRHHAPLGSGAHDPAQPIKDFTLVVLALRRLWRHQGQVGSHKAPFVIAYITGIGLSFHIPEFTKSS